jgi:hypothetical protein
MTKPIVGIAVATVVGFAAGILYTEWSTETWFPRAYGWNAAWLGDQLVSASGGQPFATEQACRTWLASVVESYAEPDEARCEKGRAR